MQISDPDHRGTWEGFQDLCTLLSPLARQREVRWDAVNWDTVIKLASEHKVGPAVFRGIEGEASVPNAIKAYFHTLQNINSRRNLSIMDQLASVLGQLNERGIVVAFLKGAASLADSLYDDPAERFILDIDLLIAPENARECDVILRGMGYKDVAPVSRWAARKHHLPGLLAPSGEFCIELHTSLSKLRLKRMISARAVFQRASIAQWRGEPIYMLHPTDRIVHNIVHSQLHHKLSKRGMVELRQLREFSLLAARYGQQIDWSDVEQRFSAAGCGDVLADQATYSRALMAVSCPIKERDADKAMHRLQTAVDTSIVNTPSWAKALGKLIGDNAIGFGRNPTVVINLINPFLWPKRFQRILAILKHGQDQRI